MTAAALAAIGGVTALFTFGDPQGGQPRAIARIQPPAAAAVEPTGSIAPHAANKAAQASSQSADEVERATGVRVTRAGGGDAPSAMIIQLDQPAHTLSLSPAPDRRLVEKSRFGPLPRIGADGAKPLDVYARPVALSQKLKSDAPRVAILMGGLGVSATTTEAALDALPGEISFAFAPYGPEVAAETKRARDRGHEVFLHAPMEPFDYPRNDPGPHTLTTAGDTAEADLQWLMGRFAGYVGLVNFLGAKFLSTDTAVTPLLREMATRGLAFIDDGAAAQSLAMDAAARMGAQAARADVALDSDPKPEAIEAALLKLEAIARKKGVALGVANALPVSIERVARFARALEQRGVALVPASAALGAGVSVNAQKVAAP